MNKQDKKTKRISEFLFLFIFLFALSFVILLIWDGNLDDIRLNLMICGGMSLVLSAIVYLSKK